MVGFARVTNEPGVLSQRCTTPAFGQGGCAVLMGCLIPRPRWVGLCPFQKRFDEAAIQCQEETKSLSEETTRLRTEIDESKKFQKSTEDWRNSEQFE